MTYATTTNRDDARPLREPWMARGLAVSAMVFLAGGVILDLLGTIAPFLSQSLAADLHLVGPVHLSVRLGTVLAFLIWLYARYSSLRSIEWGVTNYAPAAAVGWFFVPLLNLYKPYLVVQEMWEATSPREGLQGDSRLVLAWWTSFIAAPLAVFTFAWAPTSESASLESQPVIIVNALNTVAGVLAIWVIATIDRRWRAKFEALRGLAPARA